LNTIPGTHYHQQHLLYQEVVIIMLKRIFSPRYRRRGLHEDHNIYDERSGKFLLPDIESRPNIIINSSSTQQSHNHDGLLPKNNDDLYMIPPPLESSSCDFPTRSESTSLFAHNENYGSGNDNKDGSDLSDPYSTEPFETNNRTPSFEKMQIAHFDNSDYDYNYNDDDDDDDDDDLSYDDDEDKFKFDESMITCLRGTSSPFYTTRKKVKYQVGHHFSLITQMYASVWPKVFPYCLFNVIWCFTIDYMNDNNVSVELE
jgi:hypothetical protein